MVCFTGAWCTVIMGSHEVLSKTLLFCAAELDESTQKWLSLFFHAPSRYISSKMSDHVSKRFPQKQAGRLHVLMKMAFQFCWEICHQVLTVATWKRSKVRPVLYTLFEKSNTYLYLQCTIYKYKNYPGLQKQEWGLQFQLLIVWKYSIGLLGYVREK